MMMHGKTKSDPRERMSEHSTRKEQVSEKVALSKEEKTKGCNE
jgi:hypothetical protein